MESEKSISNVREEEIEFILEHPEIDWHFLGIREILQKINSNFSENEKSNPSLQKLLEAYPV